MRVAVPIPNTDYARSSAMSNRCNVGTSKLALLLLGVHPRVRQPLRNPICATNIGLLRSSLEPECFVAWSDSCRAMVLLLRLSQMACQSAQTQTLFTAKIDSSHPAIAETPPPISEPLPEYVSWPSKWSVLRSSENFNTKPRPPPEISLVHATCGLYFSEMKPGTPGWTKSVPE
jgi:hypothetical protein